LYFLASYIEKSGKILNPFFQFGHKDGNDESLAVADLSFLQELNNMAKLMTLGTAEGFQIAGSGFWR
jgi:hypothetical protein